MLEKDVAVASNELVGVALGVLTTVDVVATESKESFFGRLGGAVGVMLIVLFVLALERLWERKGMLFLKFWIAVLDRVNGPSNPPDRVDGPSEEDSKLFLRTRGVRESVLRFDGSRSSRPRGDM